MAKRGGDDSGADFDHSNPVTTQFPAQRIRDGVERVLGCAIGRGPGKGNIARDRAHVHDSSEPLPAHHWNYQLSQPQRSYEVDLEHASQELDFQVRCRRV